MMWKRDKRRRRDKAEGRGKEEIQKEGKGRGKIQREGKGGDRERAKIRERGDHEQRTRGRRLKYRKASKKRRKAPEQDTQSLKREKMPQSEKKIGTNRQKGEIRPDKRPTAFLAQLPSQFQLENDAFRR